MKTEAQSQPPFRQVPKSALAQAFPAAEGHAHQGFLDVYAENSKVEKRATLPDELGLTRAKPAQTDHETGDSSGTTEFAVSDSATPVRRAARSDIADSSDATQRSRFAGANLEMAAKNGSWNVAPNGINETSRIAEIATPEMKQAVDSGLAGLSPPDSGETANRHDASPKTSLTPGARANVEPETGVVPKGTTVGEAAPVNNGVVFPAATPMPAGFTDVSAESGPRKQAATMAENANRANSEISESPRADTQGEEQMSAGPDLEGRHQKRPAMAPGAETPLVGQPAARPVVFSGGEPQNAPPFETPASDEPELAVATTGNKANTASSATPMDDMAKLPELPTTPENARHHLGELALAERLQATETFSVNAFPKHVDRTGFSQHVAAPIIEAARGLSNGPVEIALSPEELGRVRMTMNAGDNSMSVAITAERPETLELLRRHIDTLASLLRELGYDDVALDLRSHGNDSSDKGQGDAPAKYRGPDIQQTDNETFAENSSVTRLTLGTTSGVDIRI